MHPKPSHHAGSVIAATGAGPAKNDAVKTVAYRVFGTVAVFVAINGGILLVAWLLMLMLGSI